MKKLLNKFKANLRTNLLILFIGFGLGVAFFFLYIYVLSSGPYFINMTDACFILTAVYLAVGGLMWVARLGFFDTFAYGFISVGNVFFRPVKVEKKYDDLIDYKTQKYEKRKNQGYYFLSLFMLGILALIASLVFYAFYFFIR
ncbi:MAG TPA: DUF3899 domain-containing protein [Bacilli bacterium]|nr:DUF3899 domain-containing protein [Bacilli bacterium]